MMATFPLRAVLFSTVASLLFIGSTFCRPVSAAALVSGSYLSASGTTIVLRLSIASPAPFNLIVETTLPANSGITATSPPARKVDNQLGLIKWLFKDAQTGALTLSAMLASPVKGPVLTIVRYHSPADGSFQELAISP